MKGEHQTSGGCGRTWEALGLRHLCRAPRGAKSCRCPCGVFFHEQAGLPACPAQPDLPARRRGRGPKLAQEDAAAVRRLYAGTQSAAQLARMFRVSTGTINAVIERKGAYRGD